MKPGHPLEHIQLVAIQQCSFGLNLLAIYRGGLLIQIYDKAAVYKFMHLQKPCMYKHAAHSSRNQKFDIGLELNFMLIKLT